MTTPSRRDAKGQQRDVLERITLLERRASRTPTVNATRPWLDWASKGGPTSLAREHVNVW